MEQVLGSLVNQKTNELRATVGELRQSNEDLTQTKNTLATTNNDLAKSNSQLREANKALKQHDVMQKEFINIAAHELRTPSQAITGNLELIEMQYIPSLFEGTFDNFKKIGTEIEDLVKDKQELRGFIEGILSTYRNSKRLEKIVKDILDVSRIEGNRLELYKERVNINEKVRNVINDLYTKANESPKTAKDRQINIRFETEQDPLMVLVDKSRIFQAISNLLNNAIKFSGNEPIIVSVEYMRQPARHNLAEFYGTPLEDKNITGDEKMIVVSITDKGKGIDKEIVPKMFTKFYTKSEGGTGLGLFIAKSIVEAHGGKIWARNNHDGKGATFSFSLPVENN